MSASELETQINRFKVNEERLNTFVNVDGFYTTSSGVQVPTLLNVSKRIEASVENVSLAEQSASIEITRQTNLVIEASTSAQEEFLNEDSKINTLAKNTIADWQTAITTITQTEGVPALAVSTANNETQQEINDSVGAKWYAKGGGYPINYRVMLDNGDIVKSTINGNTNNPNVDMTGWFNPDLEQLGIKTYLDNFPAYVPYNPSIIDYTDRIKTALQSGRPMVLTEGAVYPILSNILITGHTKNVDIHGKGATLKYTGVDELNMFIEIRHDIALSHSIYGLKIDCDQKAGTGLRVENRGNNDVAASDFYANKISVVNCRKTSSSHVGDALNVRGAFKSVVLEYPHVSNVAMKAGAGNPYVAGVAGLTVVHFDDDSYPEYCEIRGPHIEKVYSEDPDYTVDQDGFKFFSGNGGVASHKRRGKLIVQGGLFKNCWGRSVKLQCQSAHIYSPTFHRTEGNSTKEGNSEVNSQTGNCVLQSATYIYENGYTGGACIVFNTGSEYNYTGGVARDCEVYLDDNTTLNYFVGNHPTDGVNQTVTAEGNKIYGKARRFSHTLVNGAKNVFKYTGNTVQEIVDYDHGDGVLRKVFNVSKASGLVTPRGAILEITNNTVISDNGCSLSLDGITGVSVSVAPIAYGNVGIDDEMKGNSYNSGLKTKGIARFGAVGGPKSAAYHYVRSYGVVAGATVEVQIEGASGGMFMVGFVGVPLSHSLISVADTVYFMSNHNVPAVGETPAVTYVNYNNAQPATPRGQYWDMWRHADQGGKYVLRNNMSTTRIFFVSGVSA